MLYKLYVVSHNGKSSTMSEKVAWRFCYSEGRTLFCTFGICQRKVQWWNCQHLSNVRFSLIFLFYIFYELASCFWCKNYYYSPCCYTTKYCLFAVTKYFDTFVPNFFFFAYSFSERETCQKEMEGQRLAKIRVDKRKKEEDFGESTIGRIRTYLWNLTEYPETSYGARVSDCASLMTVHQIQFYVLCA